MGNTEVHQTSTSMVLAAPGALGAGADMRLKVRVACSTGCDLRGMAVNILAQDGVVVRQMALVSSYGAAGETDEFVARAPIEPGAYAWLAQFPAHEREGVLHEASSAPIAFEVGAHAASIAVWDVPSPIVLGEEFMIKVGVKCSAGCDLAGREIEVCDHEGALVATGALGNAPWPGTSALYWVDVRLQAPAAEGAYTWTARFQGSQLEARHEEGSQSFAFKTAKRPEHIVTIEVTEEGSKAPLKDAHVLLHPYSSHTDDCGVARLQVPKGSYRLYVTKNEYQIFQTAVHVMGDVAVSAGLEVVVHDANEQG